MRKRKKEWEIEREETIGERKKEKEGRRESD